MREVKGRVVTGRREVFQVLAIVIVLLLPLGLGVLAYTMGYQYPQDTGVRTVSMIESLVVKIAYHPELARYIGSWGNSREQVGYEMTNIGGFFKIERFTGSGEVKITVGNETAGTFKVDELKANVKLLNLTVEGLPLKIAVAICNIPDMRAYIREVPDDIRRDALRLLENHTFVRWLREEGFGYTVKEVSPIGPVVLNYTIQGVLVGLRVEDLDIFCHLYFDKPYMLTVNASIPEELKVSPYEKDNYGIYLIYDYIRESGGLIAFFPHPASMNVTRPGYNPFNITRLSNITDEGVLKEVLRIMRGNRILARLLESAGCEIKKVSGWESGGRITAVNVLLVSEKIKGYGVDVRIDLKAGKIKEVYIYSESTIATILSF